MVKLGEHLGWGQGGEGSPQSLSEALEGMRFSRVKGSIEGGGGWFRDKGRRQWWDRSPQIQGKCQRGGRKTGPAKALELQKGGSSLGNDALGKTDSPPAPCREPKNLNTK